MTDHSDLIMWELNHFLDEQMLLPHCCQYQYIRPTRKSTKRLFQMNASLMHVN